MNVVFTESEKALLDKITLLVVYNGNHIEPKTIDTTPEEYKLIFDIRKKLDLNRK